MLVVVGTGTTAAEGGTETAADAGTGTAVG
jgi:hypothetical protein